MFFNINYKRISNNINSYNFGLKLFHIGIILILSAPAFSAIFLLGSIIVSSLNRGKNYFKDTTNYIFIISGFALILSTAINNFSFFRHNLDNYEYYLSWIGLFNWIPYFYCFWAFQPYLNTPILRKKSSFYLILGSIPLLFTAIGQYWFSWYGPFKILNGLIIWFQRPLDKSDGLTGLFNNPNYAGSWLVLIFPFLLAFIIEKSTSKFNKFIFFSAASLVLFLTYFTKSRNALLGSVLSIQFLTQNKIFFILCLLFALFVTFLLVISFFPNLPFQTTSINKISAGLFFGNFNNITLNFENYPRLIMIRDAITFALERPLIGWGSASFPILFFQKNNIWYGHTHNIFIELAISYGFISALLIMTGIVIILLKSFREIYLKKNNTKENFSINFLYFDKAWWTASFVLLTSQLFDIQFLDFRISIIFWIFLSGLSTIKFDTNKNGASISNY